MIEESKYEANSLNDAEIADCDILMNKYEIVKDLVDSDPRRCIYLVTDPSGKRYVLKKSRNVVSTRHYENPHNEMEIMRYLTEESLYLNDSMRHFCKYFDSWSDVDYCYLVEEYCLHGDLFSMVERNKNIDENLARKWCYQLLKGMAELHVRGIYHLDLSTENILLQEDENKEMLVKICDFGMCQRSGDLQSIARMRIPRDRKSPGKRGYMAPEVYSKKEFDPSKADCYSVGVILFIMVFGFPPYEYPDVHRDVRFDYIISGKIADLCRLYKVKLPSDDILDLLSKILCEESERISIDDALNHRCFASITR